jgi:hypothetical protein
MSAIPLMVVAAVVSWTDSAGAAGSTIPNLVANPGFESAVPATVTTCGGLPTSVGNWTGYAQSPGQGPSIVSAPEPVFSGSHSAAFSGAARTGCAAGGWYQDVTFTAGDSYTLTAEVYPSSGSQNLSFILGWGHGSGTTLAEDDVFVTPTATTLHAWGVSATAAPLSYGHWHRVQVRADGVQLGAKLIVDGKTVATVSKGTRATGSSDGTVYVGHVAASDTAASDFFYDAVSLSSAPYVLQAKPPTVTPGQTTSVIVRGGNFDQGATVSVSGSGVTVASTRVKAADSIVVGLAVGATAPSGPRNVTVTSGGVSATCSGCLTVG